jgi:REP element-mobilizing transposase RayT
VSPPFFSGHFTTVRAWLNSPLNNLQFFNPYADIRHTANRLPHWQQQGSIYFVTFRLADAIPIKLRSQWQNERDQWLQLHPQPWTAAIEQEYHKRFSGAIESWLDAGHGSCLLRRPNCAAAVGETLRYFDGQRLALISAVVMPNHVHALFVQNPDVALEKLISSWKTFSTRVINRLLGRSGKLWQRDYFDRLVRDQQHFANCVRYLRRNPERAVLKRNEYILYQSELAEAIE